MDNPLTGQALEETGLSTPFCDKARDMGFQTIADILEVQPSELTRLSGFSYGWLNELVAFLDEKGCLHLLQL